MKYTLRISCSGFIFIVFLAFSAAFLSSCNGKRIPENYAARSIIGEDIEFNQLGIPVVSDRCREIYVYRNKTYIAVTYEGDHSEISPRVSVQSWKELLTVLGNPVIMEEGDVATLSKESFISYMETLYP